jgi:hypothetical protein
VKHFGGIASFSIGEGKIPDAVIEEAKWQIGHGNGAWDADLKNRRF